MSLDSELLYYGYSADTSTSSTSISSIFTNKIQFVASGSTSELVAQGYNSIPYCYIATLLPDDSSSGFYNGNTLVITDINGYTYTWSYPNNAGLSLTSGSYTPPGSSTSESILQMILNPLGFTTTNPNGVSIITTYTQSNVSYYVLKEGTYDFIINGGQSSSFTFSQLDTTSSPQSQTITYIS